jgi:UDP-N-acetylmuramate--alanine ligase
LSTPAFAGRKLHLIAIGGAGMSGLAIAAHALGAEVSGSDQSESSYMERLRAAGLRPRVGHDAAAVPADADVVISTAIPEDNPELVRARERGQRVMHRSELLAELCGEGELIAVAGAHGKTTTSGMLTHMLRGAGAEPAWLLGGELPGAGPDGTPANAGWGRGGIVVAEADESDGSFLRLRPAVAAVTNVELDHHANWSGESELLGAFATFAAAASAAVVPVGARLDGIAGRERTVRTALGGEADTPRADLVATAIEAEAGGSSFELLGAGEPLRVRVGIPGRHNVANALTALAALWVAGAGARAGLPPLERLAAELARFPGMARRLERKGGLNGAVIFDDYAHHPTEVAACIAALRELPHRRLIAVFQPHLYSRTKALAARFGRALAGADAIGLLDVYAARERPEGELAGVSGLDVARAVADAAPGREVSWLATIETAREHLRERLGPGDLLVTIGAGDVFRLGELLAAGGDGR